jgi:ligand-binding SRPBCC domain-containing protein
MGLHVLQREQRVPASLEATFGFFSSVQNLKLITPPWLSLNLVSAPAKIGAGSELVYRIKWHWITLAWVTEIGLWRPPEQFVDVQKRGPYRLWRHTHHFRASGTSTLVFDTVEYGLPFGVFGDLVHRWIVERDLNAIFDYRESRIRELLKGSLDSFSVGRSSRVWKARRK